jgi:serine/threonine protein kinase
MLTPNDRVVLLDFGIAKLIGETSLTSTGQVVGTPDYMAPEVIRAEETDHRADIYSLGVVLYEMVTGRTPFRAETPLAILHAQLYTPPPPPREFLPSLPADVERVILTALAKDPAARFQTATALARAFANSVGARQ